MTSDTRHTVSTPPTCTRRNRTYTCSRAATYRDTSGCFLCGPHAAALNRAMRKKVCTPLSDEQVAK